MKICLISYEFPPTIGGEATYTYGLAKALGNSGHEVTVITTTNEKKKQISNDEDLKIIRLPNARLLPKMFFFNVEVQKILEEFEMKKMDILHITSDYNGIFDRSKTAKIPVVATIHHPYAQERRIYRASTNYIEYLKYAFHKKINYLELNNRHLCKNSDRLIAVSNYTAKSIMSEYGIHPNKISIIPNAVDTNKFNPEIDGTTFRKKLNITSEKIVLFVGRLDFQKGIKYLITAFPQVIKDFPDARLVVVGDGPLKKTIIENINKYNLSEHVFLIGRANVEDLPGIYAASDIFVVPSLMEGFGIVYLEAMACGKACIGTNIGGVEDVILDGRTGFLVSPADPGTISLAINKLLSDEETLAKFGKEGRTRVLDNFLWKKVAVKILDVYNEMLE